MKTVNDLLSVVAEAFSYVEEFGIEDYIEDNYDTVLAIAGTTSMIPFWEGLEPLDPEDPPLGYLSMKFISNEDWSITVFTPEREEISILDSNEELSLEQLQQAYDESSAVYYVDSNYVESKMSRLGATIALFLGAAASELYELERNSS